MTQEEKNLLLRDLCSRLLYGVKVQYEDKIFTIDYISAMYEEVKLNTPNRYTIDVLEVKPYLFPLSSMTEEQYESLKGLGILSNCSHSYEYVNPHIHGVSFIFKEFKTYSLELIEWLNKNHFDYRGLIPLGLAIDCTNLNIY